MWQRLAVSLCIAMVSLTLCEAGKWYRYSYPNPRIDVSKCGRNKLSYVCDPDKLLDAYEANLLDKEIEHLMNYTSCPCSVYACSQGTRGYKVGVALVEEMITDAEHNKQAQEDEHNDVDTMLDESIKFSFTLLSEWNLGECEEDLIIFYSAKDHVLYTFTGDLTKKKLKNNIVGEIAMVHRKKFQNEKYYDGIKSLIMEYRNVFLGKYERKTSEPNGPKYAAIYGSDSSSVLMPCLATSLLMAVVTYMLH